ncbi:MAG: hypothetical protein MI864_11280 [Pseudomonadales bacterium]|nr:hypothetical protein [Pseudomonadales bacterium]
MRVNCSSIVMLFYIISNHIGLVFLFFAEHGVKQLSYINKDTVLYLAACSSVVVLIYIVIDALLLKVSPYQRFVDVKAITDERINYIPIIAIGLLTGAVAMAKFLDNSPLLMLLSGDFSGAHSARLSTYSDGNYFWGIKPSYLKIIFEVLLFAMTIPLVKFATNKKTGNLLFYIPLLIIVMLESMSNVSKGALIIPLFQIWILYSLVSHSSQLNNRFILWAVTIAVIIISSISAYIMHKSAIDFLYPIERLTLGNLIPQYVVVNYFNFDNLLYGATAPPWMSFGAHTQILLDVFAWKELMGWSDGSYYTAPSSFVAHGHANLHIFGVMLLTAAVFFFLRMIDLLLITVKSETIYVALMVYTCYHFSILATGASITFMFDYYYFASILFAFLFYSNSLTQNSKFTNLSMKSG